MNTIKNILEKLKTKRENKKTIFSLDVFLFILLPVIFLIVLIHGTNYLFNNIASVNTYFLDKNVSFKNKDEIKKIISEEENKILTTKVVFSIEGIDSNKTLQNTYLSNLIDSNSKDKIVEQMFSKFSNTKIDPELFLSNLFKTKKYNFDYSINKDKLDKIKEEIKKNEKATVNASIVKDESSVKFVTKKEEIGFNYDLNVIDNNILSYINSINRNDVINISINKVVNNPSIIEEKLTNTLLQSNTILDNAPINIFYNDKKISLERADLINMLTFEYSLNDKNEFTEAGIKLKEDNIKTYLDKISNENDKKPEAGELVIENGKAKKFVPVTKGTALNKDDSYSKLQDAILTLKKDVFLTIEESMPTDIDSEVVKYGLLEKIAEGTSNFKGSSSNRIHNITVGTGFVNGTLIKPGEEFSMIKTLKAVNAAMGYVTELVIKGNKTEAEYGGGLCQVGTTMFRSAINGGFPILERQNHSYRVPYYEPAGTDATIYFPKPDFRFLNNTKNYILITTNIDLKTHTLTYSVWGTKDNRKIKIGNPVITNIVMAPGTKWIETLDLPVGKVKCTETSHNGADAEFTYNVEYDDGTKFDKVFKSHYTPWQAVCMKGVEKLSTDVATNAGITDTSTTNNKTEATTQTVEPSINSIDANSMK